MEKIYWILFSIGLAASFCIGWAVAMISVARDKTLKRIPEGFTVVSNEQLLALFNTVPTSVKISLANQALKDDEDSEP